MSKKALYTTGIVLFLLTFFSCRKGTEKPSWDTEVLAPLINSTFDINNILPDSILQENPDSSLEIVYQKSLYNFDIGNLFTIPDTGISNSYKLANSYIFSPGQNFPPITNPETAFQFPGIELKTFHVKSGKFILEIENNVREAIKFVYTIPCATLKGIPFSENAEVPGRIGKTPGVYRKEVDLREYVIDLTGPTGSKVNIFYSTIQVGISASALDTVLITPNDSVVLKNSFSHIVPSYARGYLGQNTIEVPSTQTDLTFFDRIGGNVKLEAVKFDLSLDNFIGVDARATLKSLKSINTHTNKTVSLVTSTPSVNINRAADNGSVVIPTHAYFGLTSSNSNIKELIENIPNKMEYQLKVTMNPLGNVSGSNDFIYTDKLLNGYLDLRVPLSFVANNLTLTSVLNLAISSGDNRHINNGILTLFANNGFPFDASIQVFTLTDEGNITDSLIGTNNTILQAPVDAQLKVTSKRLTKLTLPVSTEKMQLLYNTKKVKLVVKFNTAAQPQYIKIYDKYTLDIKLVGDFNYTLQTQ